MVGVVLGKLRIGFERSVFKDQPPEEMSWLGLYVLLLLGASTSLAT